MFSISLGGHPVEYQDKGCQLHPACLTCPFPDCLQDTLNHRQWLSRQRTLEYVAYVKQHGIAAAAQRFGVSERGYSGR